MPEISNYEQIWIFRFIQISYVQYESDKKWKILNFKCMWFVHFQNKFKIKINGVFTYVNNDSLEAHTLFLAIVLNTKSNITNKAPALHSQAMRGPLCISLWRPWLTSRQNPKLKIYRFIMQILFLKDMEEIQCMIHNLRKVYRYNSKLSYIF